MAIVAHCSGCSRTFRTADRSRDRPLRCPACGTGILADGPRVPDNDVFISYSSHDKPIADGVCAALEAAKLRCWIAPRDVPAGSSWASAIVGAIEDSTAMVLICSASAATSQQVLREVERAVAKGLAIIPLRVDHAKLSREFEYFLGTSHWLDACVGSMETAIENVTRVVRSLVAELADASSAEGAEDGPKRHATAELMAKAVPRRRRWGWLRPAGTVVAIVLGIGAVTLALRGRGRPDESRISPPATSSPQAAGPAARGSATAPPMSNSLPTASLVSQDRRGPNDGRTASAQASTRELPEPRADGSTPLSSPHPNPTAARRPPGEARRDGDHGAPEVLASPDTMTRWLALTAPQSRGADLLAPDLKLLGEPNYACDVSHGWDAWGVSTPPDLTRSIRDGRYAFRFHRQNQGMRWGPPFELARPRAVCRVRARLLGNVTADARWGISWDNYVFELTADGRFVVGSFRPPPEAQPPAREPVRAPASATSTDEMILAVRDRGIEAYVNGELLAGPLPLPKRAPNKAVLGVTLGSASSDDVSLEIEQYELWWPPDR